MKSGVGSEKRVLITGGTSGLGIELVKLFLKKRYKVVATGRNELNFSDENLRFVAVDFSDMEKVAHAMKKLLDSIDSFDIIINNAGVLSPPDFKQTDNGLEYTFQVNFLSHLLINEIILKNSKRDRPVIIAAVTSPVYRIAKPDLIILPMKSDYRPFKAYSNSKLYLAFMCKYLPERFPGLNLKCIGFDPGTFSSGIYRMQKQFFRRLYKIAAPFMRSPGKVALVLSELITREDLLNGSVYDLRRRVRSVQQINGSVEDIFWNDCYNRIEPFL